MPIKYADAPDVKKLAYEIIECLNLYHVVPQFLHCYRSKGSTSTRTIARIHGLGKIWQDALNMPASYVIEVISERYDKLCETDKEKTIIHELLHIPHGFQGGFRPHKGYIDTHVVVDLHRELRRQRQVRATSF